MAEIPNSDSPSPFPSSPIPSIHDNPLLSDASSRSLHSSDFDFEEDEGNDGISIGSEAEEDSGLDDDSDLDNESDSDEDEEYDEDNDDEIDPDDLDLRHGDDDDDDDFFDDFEFHIRDVGVDFDPLAFMDDPDLQDLQAGDYFDLHDDEGINALQHAFFNGLEHHIAQENWGSRSRSPAMNQQYHGGAGAGAGVGARGRPRAQRDQLVRIEMVDHSNDGAGSSNGGVVNGNGNGNGNGDGGGNQRELRPPFVNFIDLTGDDDADQPARAVPHRPSGNQRRLRSQPQNAPPRLNRSDGSYIDGQQDVIVLSSSDDEDRPMRNMPRRGAQNNRQNIFNSQSQNQNQNQNQQNAHPHPHRHNDNVNPFDRGARNIRFDEQLRQPGLTSAPVPAHGAQNPNANGPFHPLAQLMQTIPLFRLLDPTAQGMANRNQNHDDDVVFTGERNVGNLRPMPAPRPFLGLGPINLDYRPFGGPVPPMPVVVGGGGGGGGPPKPTHQPPGPARPGFTRDTGEDVVAICPSCDQELAYDPEGDDTPATPARKSRSKKATAEHHFWAVKACGHVYCKRCFDNRRPSAKSAIHVGFRPGGEGGKKLFCAVEDCESDVSAKNAWVGIFM